MTKFVILVIASKNNERENNLVNFWRQLINKYEQISDIDTYLLFNNETINNEYIINKDKNKIIFREAETFIPGILNKTIKAFELLKNDYEIFFRTNLSSYIDYKKIITIFNELLNYKYVYGGIKNRKRKYFASGSGFFISKSVLNDYLLKENLLNIDIIDDYIIGIVLLKYMNNIYYYEGRRADLHGKIRNFHNICNNYHYRLKNEIHNIEKYNFVFLLSNT